MLEARLRLLAIADDVDPEFALLVHDLAYRLGRLAPERGGIERLPAHAREQQRREGGPSRQAARMRGENAMSAFRKTGHCCSGLVRRSGSRPNLRRFRCGMSSIAPRLGRRPRFPHLTTESLGKAQRADKLSA